MCGGSHLIGESHLEGLAREARTRKPIVIQVEPDWSPYPQGG